MLAAELGMVTVTSPGDPSIPIPPDEPWNWPESFREVRDPGDTPFEPGCVCCYGRPNCTQIRRRSVDECYPGGPGGDDLSESVASTTCTRGIGCAQRKQYKCSDLVPVSLASFAGSTAAGWSSLRVSAP